MLKHCAYCGAGFTPVRSSQIFCTATCRASHNYAARKDTPDEKARWAKKNVGQTARLTSEQKARYAANQKARYHSDESHRSKLIEASRTRYQTATYGHPTPDILTMTKDRFRHARALGYRSGLEVKNAKHLDDKGAEYAYEPFRLPYVKPERNATYTPDFVLSSGIIIDTKGVWLVEDRQKFALLKAQHPDLDIRMVFTNPQQKISKGSKTSYADICIKLGIPFAKDTIPSAWLIEPANGASLAAIERLRK